MKKIFILSLLLAGMFGTMFAQTATKVETKKETVEVRKKADVKQAKITFDKLKHDFGTFSGDEPVVTCVFGFVNDGDAPLVIHQAIASCGCTVPTYTRMPIKPGEKGEIEVTYNGYGKTPGKFTKSITVRTNAAESTVRLYITGHMTEPTGKKKTE